MFTETCHWNCKPIHEIISIYISGTKLLILQILNTAKQYSKAGFVQDLV